MPQRHACCSLRHFMIRPSLLDLLVLVSLCLAPSNAFAQTTATLVGQVVDTTGGTLASVAVTATHTDTGLVRRAVTDDRGRFVFAAASVGSYTLRAERSGFRPLVQTGVRLSVAEQATVTLVMQVGTTEEVTVVSGTATVNVRSGELSYLVDERTMARIPINGRNFTDLMSLVPSVTPFPHRDNGSVVAHGLAMSVNGQDPRANVYLLDGTLLNDFTNGPAGSAAGTALGMDTVREFRVEANAYSAEFGRNVGGQVNAITKSGTNIFSGSAFEYHRNDALDARNYFDPSTKPPFRRNQFGSTFGGPIARDRLFFFGGYEGLRETLGRTVVSTVPDADARLGVLPTGSVTIDPAVLPYLNEFPRANGSNLGGGLAQFTFPFDQRLAEHFAQARVDVVFADGAQLFGRYTVDDTEQRLPMDFPQFPRAFVSTNQFVTSEYRKASSSRMLHTARFGYSRTRIGQNVESNTSQPLPVFVPGRAFMGAIDIGGLPRFGPQSSAGVRLRQDVLSGQYDLSLSRGRHLVRIGTLFEHYRDDESNPTFSLGIFRFANLSTFLRNLPAQFIGLTPEGDINRHWNWTLYGVYLQDDWQLVPDLTATAGVRMEGTSMPVDTGGRDVNMRDLLASAPTPGPLYNNPGPSVSPRLGLSWNVGGRGRTAVRGGYGLYYNTNNHQNLIVTVTNPPATPRVVIANPTFPVPPFSVATGISVRPIQFNVQLPRVQMWNVNVQQEFWRDWAVTIGYAGSRGRHLWRNSDLNVPTPARLADGTWFYAAGLPRPNPNFSAIEVKSSDGDSRYRALIVDVRKRWAHGLQAQSAYTWSRSEDTTQNSTFFSDSTTATTSAMPEVIPGYNKGLSDFHAEHNLVMTFVWEVPHAPARGGVAGAILNGWRVSGIVRARSGSPLTPMLQTNRSRSLWSPALGPGTGPDRPSYAPGRGPGSAVTGDPNRWFDPAAFVLQPAGTFGSVGRNELIGPDLRTVDLAIGRSFGSKFLGAGRAIDLRLEVFNLLNRVNFGAPSLIAFAGTTDGETPLASFGQIRTTLTSARQLQLGLRLTF
jgi:Carboxypeptidase regulatory-like domain/TonB dependent receptor